MARALDGFVAIPISQQLFMRLAQRFPNGVSGVVEDVLDHFLERTSNDLVVPDHSAYEWEHLKLPPGTKIRTKYYGEHIVAEVVDGKLLWKGTQYPSMSQLARAMRGNTSNNAWVVLELQFPGESKWTLADRLRG